MPSIEPGVSHDLAIWRAARYSDVRYKINLTIEKMSPVLKGTIEIRVKVEGEKRSGREKETAAAASEPGAVATGFLTPIILDWRKIAGHEKDSIISNVSLNGAVLSVSPSLTVGLKQPNAGSDPDTQARASRAIPGSLNYEESNEHLIFGGGVIAGENVIKLDFTSPILTSGSAITRYVDKEDGAEYIYSLFVPSDASTAFPVFDQPDLKARFTLTVEHPEEWNVVSNGGGKSFIENRTSYVDMDCKGCGTFYYKNFEETKPISTYVFAFAAGPFHSFGRVSSFPGIVRSEGEREPKDGKGDYLFRIYTQIYVRKSQAEKFKPHAAEIFRLNREGIKYLEGYFDYKFPFPKYDIVLIPEFPFGGMEHAGATFLREDRVIFPQEPTANDYITRANVIFHETAHQWFGDTVTMKWFDDLWLKEGFAEFMAYKTLERVMPQYNAWKVFYERNKQTAYLTDSTKGTTPIYQKIDNLSAAKSAYGNIVYRKAPSFLRQAEFYLGPDKFQTAVRAFLKNHAYANAGWEDLVKEFEGATEWDLHDWAQQWVKTPGLTHITDRPFRGVASVFGSDRDEYNYGFMFDQRDSGYWPMKTKALFLYKDGSRNSSEVEFQDQRNNPGFVKGPDVDFVFGNYQDYGYGIFLLDDKSRDYVLKNIQNEKDLFLRAMMWGSLWDSVREGELDPKEYVELVIKNIPLEKDESTIQSLLGRVSTAMNYYLTGERVSSPHVSKGSPANPDRMEPSLTVGLQTRLEAVLTDRMQNASTLGQRITFYRAFLNTASTEDARNTLKQMLTKGGNPSGSAGVPNAANTRPKNTLPTGRVSAAGATIPLKTKDKFDIVTRLAILGDPDAAQLLADLEKTENSDDAKRYAYAARAGFATAENKAKYWSDFLTNKDISESWIEAAFGPFN
ncbi:MAG: M1 family metallopeptidase, partial [Pyrinomonadaceae bacterium]